ncbi:MAG: calcium-binding protein [Synechococcales bacterium]|nr:calcium-binding protein [Synechococcales bacterium]
MSASLPPNRLGALEATKDFPPGTIGYGVHQGIDLLYNGVSVPGFLLGIVTIPRVTLGGLGDRYSAQIGTLFQRPEMQALMARPATDQAAQLEVAQREVEYWKGVLNNPNSSAEDKKGAELAMVFSAERRAEIQKDFADGRSELEVAEVFIDIISSKPEFVPELFGQVIADFLIWKVIDDVNMVLIIADYVREAFAAASRRLFDPLVLDLDGDGIELVSVEQSIAQFDLNADGFREQTGWVKADDGMLVLDANGDGRINNITELFGDATTDGFDELKTLDSNNDNIINASDAKFSQLQIWRDLNQDGITDSGELSNLGRFGIQSISLNTTKANTVNQGNQVRTTSQFTLTDGTHREIASIWYVVDRLNTQYDQPYRLNPGTLFLPSVRGYGGLADLHIAMSLDSKLLDLMREFVALKPTELEQIAPKVEAILFRWAGVDDVAQTSRGQYFDARKLGFLEKFLQQPLPANFTNANQTVFIQQSWDLIFKEISARLVAQSLLRGAFPNSTYSLKMDSLRTEDSLTAILDRLTPVAPADALHAVLYWSYAITALDAHRDRFKLTPADYNNQLKTALTTHGLSNYLEALRHPAYGSTLNESLHAEVTGGFLHGKTGNDVLYGNAGNDMLWGGQGDDYLDGAVGADIYRYQLGDGNDTLYDSSADNGIDQLIFSGTGLTANNAIVTRLGESDHLQIAFKDIDGSIQLRYQLYSSNQSNYGIESITFSDGIVWNEVQLWNAYLGLGADTNDKLEGTTENDILVGGKGNDYLDGKWGADIYRYQLGDGNDTLYDSSADNGIDQLIFSGAGLTANNAIVTRLGESDHLQIAFKDTSGSIQLRYQLYISNQSNYGIESITFSDGIVWNEVQLWNAYLGLGADTNDKLEGTTENDTLVGGKGHDLLTGRGGADRFVFDSGTAFTTADLGIDRITDFTSNLDQIVLGKTTFAALTSLANRSLSPSEFATIHETTNGATVAGASSAPIVFNRANGSLFYNPDGATAGLTGGGQFATLAGGTSLSASDFLLRI